MKVKRISPEQAQSVIDTCKPKGLFWYQENGKFYVLDSYTDTGLTLLNEFGTYVRCMQYLNALAFEINSREERRNSIKKLFRGISEWLAIFGAIILAAILLGAPNIPEKTYYFLLMISVCMLSVAFFIYIFIHSEKNGA